MKRKNDSKSLSSKSLYARRLHSALSSSMKLTPREKHLLHTYGKMEKPKTTTLPQIIDQRARPKTAPNSRDSSTSSAHHTKKQHDHQSNPNLVPLFPSGPFESRRGSDVNYIEDVQTLGEMDEFNVEEEDEMFEEEFSERVDGQKASTIDEPLFLPSVEAIQRTLFNLEKHQKALEDHAATSIQKCWRGYVARQLAKRRKAFVILYSTLVVQSSFRMYRCRKKVRMTNEYAVRVQKAMRLFICRKTMKRKKKCAIVIQTAVRKFLDRKKEENYLQSVILLKRAFRSRFQQMKRKTMNEAALKIQKLVRGYKVRKILRFLIHFTVRLQSKVRGFIIRNRKKKGKLTVQNIKEFQNENTPVLLIQKVFKGYEVRSIMSHIGICANRIQKTWRCATVKRKYKKMRESVLNIQKWYRNISAIHEARNQIILWNYKAALIQKVFRSFYVRKEGEVRETASLELQSMLRCGSVFLKSNSVKLGVRKIQTWFIDTWKIGIREFEYTKNQRTIAQKIVRGYLARGSLDSRKELCIKIQKNARVFLVRKRIQISQRCALKIQTWFRMMMSKRLVLRMKESIKRLEPVVQGLFVRRNLIKVHRCLTVIQSNFHRRRIIQVRELWQKSAFLIQAAYRTYILPKKYQEMRSSAKKIQLAYRTYKTKHLIQQYQRSSSIIARNFLMYMHQKMYQFKKRRVTTAQGLFHGFLARKKLRNYESKVIIIQKVWRGFIVRKKNSVIEYKLIIIQSQFRSYLSRKKVKRMKSGVEKIGNVVYSFILRQRYIKDMEAIKTIHRYWQRYSLSRKRKLYSSSVSKIIASYRKQKMMREAEKKNQSALLIQKVFRGFKARKWIKQLRKAVNVITRKIKGNGQMEKLRKCVKIQSIWKAILLRRRYEKQKKSAFVIIPFYRGYRDRKTQRERINAATTIQRNWRGFMARKLMNRKTRAVMALERFFMGYMESSNGLHVTKGMLERLILQQQKQCAIVIQKAWRRWKGVKRFRILKRFAIIIEKVFKSYMIRKQRKIIHHSVRLIQNAWRIHHECKMRLLETRKVIKLKKQVLYSVKIAKIWRGIMKRKKFRYQQQCATKIQKVWRGYWERKNLRKREKNSTQIQKIWRSYVTVKKIIVWNLKVIEIQKYWRRVMVCREIKRRTRAATKIQRFFWTCKRRMILRKMTNSANKNEEVVRINIFNTTSDLYIYLDPVMKIQEAYRSYRHSKQTST